MRSILIVIYLILFIIIGFPFLIIGWSLGYINKKLQYKYGFWVGKSWANSLLSLAGTKSSVYGLDYIPKNQAVLFVGNHRSWFDIPILYQHLPNPTGFIAKKEMGKIPVFSWWMTCVGCLFLDRKDVRSAMKTILQGVEQLKEGHSMVIFPEGTRSQSTAMLPFKQGSLKLAEKAKIPIIPFAIINSDDILERHGLKVTATNTTLQFGKPVYLSDLSDEDKKYSARYLQDIVKRLYDAH